MAASLGLLPYYTSFNLKQMAKEKNATPLTLEEALAALEISKKETAEAFEIIADLKKQLSEKATDLKTANKDFTVTHNSKSYKVIVPTFRHNGVVIKASELADNEAVINELVEMESGVLQEITE